MKNGAIAFIDILGFKGIWQTMPEDKLLGVIREVSEVVKKVIGLFRLAGNRLIN